MGIVDKRDFVKLLRLLFEIYRYLYSIPFGKHNAFGRMNLCIVLLFCHLTQHKID